VALHAGIPKAFIREYREFMQAPKDWVWRDWWEIDGVMYFHGEGFSGQAGALKCANQNRKSSVIGHLHSFGGVQWSASMNDLIFGMNVGCLIDEKAYSFRYAKNIMHKPTLGCGVVKDGTLAAFVPMDAYLKTLTKKSKTKGLGN